MIFEFIFYSILLTTVEKYIGFFLCFLRPGVFFVVSMENKSFWGDSLEIITTCFRPYTTMHISI